MAENETDEKPPPRKREGKICGQCWPDGWPGDDSAASCEHGTWKR